MVSRNGRSSSAWPTPGAGKHIACGLAPWGGGGGAGRPGARRQPRLPPRRENISPAGSLRGDGGRELDDAAYRAGSSGGSSGGLRAVLSYALGVGQRRGAKLAVSVQEGN